MKTQNPFIGRARGSAGGMTFSKVYDKNVARAKAFEVNNPKTQAQQTQRNFFKEVADVVSTVSEEKLRSLFGIKPKTMSRRNALSKQVAAAFSVNGNVKEVDFSKLQAIGNGDKVTTPIIEFIDGDTPDDTQITVQMLGPGANNDTNYIVVIFDAEHNSIVLANLPLTADENMDTYSLVHQVTNTLNGFAYVTCASDGANVVEKPFGSFNLKTRAIGNQ